MKVYFLKRKKVGQGKPLHKSSYLPVEIDRGTEWAFEHDIVRLLLGTGFFEIEYKATSGAMFDFMVAKTKTVSSIELSGWYGWENGVCSFEVQGLYKTPERVYDVGTNDMRIEI